jgi:hypothetical protein
MIRHLLGSIKGKLISLGRGIVNNRGTAEYRIEMYKGGQASLEK